MTHRTTWVEVETDKYFVSARVQINYKAVDTSFSHAFGIKRHSDLEINDIEVEDVLDMNINRFIEPDPELEKLIIETARALNS